ncbi:hypothetical protein [Maribellus mangrovi]|uniref:hypothetical protein n=1 Tax=Maribellus mangrovi TaxID=3133146 RepID=UPI0030EB709B
MAKRIKGSVSPEMAAGRVLAHGKVTDLSAGFNIDKGYTPFSLFIIEKANKSTDPVLVNCETWHGDGFADCPLTPNCWDVPFVRRINTNGIDLALYDVYWGTGGDVSDDDE